MSSIVPRAEPDTEKEACAPDSRLRASLIEKHTDHRDITRDVIIGFADGLTVPFALTAGLSS